MNSILSILAQEEFDVISEEYQDRAGGRRSRSNTLGEEVVTVVSVEEVSSAEAKRSSLDPNIQYVQDVFPNVDPRMTAELFAAGRSLEQVMQVLALQAETESTFHVANTIDDETATRSPEDELKIQQIKAILPGANEARAKKHLISNHAIYNIQAYRTNFFPYRTIFSTFLITTMMNISTFFIERFAVHLSISS